MSALKRLFSFCILVCFVEAATIPVVPPASVVNNASFAVGTVPLAPGTIAAIFGSNLDDGTNNSFSSFGPNGALLTTLGGASVTFNGIPAPMFSAFPGQLNVQIPEGLGSASSASVVVTVAGQSSAAQTVPIGSFSPGIFSINQKGTGQGAIQIANTSTYAAAAGSISGSATQAVKPGEFITIYCTGLGAVNNPPASGTAASNNPPSTTKTNPTVTIGGQAATVSFSGLAPGYVGLYQVNAQIPASAGGGSAVPVTLSIGGVKSNTVTIAIAGPAPGAIIAAANQHTCAVTSAGAVLCWGRNNYGQLGNGGSSTSDTPVPVTGLSSGVASVSAGQDSACALTKTGTVMCWGYNSAGELGNGTNTDSNVPVQVLNAAGTGPLSGVVAITSGQYHVCALTTTGTVLCWGQDGQVNAQLPLQVTGIPSDIVAISGGSFFTCALTSAGAMWCWGESGFGDLGAGTGIHNENPIAVLNTAGNAPLGGIASINAGFADVCAVTNSASLLCWGANQDGEDGNNNNIQNNIPVPVLNLAGSAALTGITAVSGGNDDTCALTSAGGVLCWGSDSNGQLGNGNNSFTQSDIPVQVSGLTSGVTEIASGYRHNCAVTTSGGVMCWGFNITGQLGNGNANDSNVPVTVVGVGGVGLLQLF